MHCGLAHALVYAPADTPSDVLGDAVAQPPQPLGRQRHCWSHVEDGSPKKPRDHLRLLFGRAGAPADRIVDPVRHVRETRNNRRGRHDLHMASGAFLGALVRADGPLVASLRAAFALEPEETSTSTAERVSTPAGLRHGQLNAALSNALGDGEHAEFTDAKELALYTTFRLAARTRQLYIRRSLL